MGKPANYNLDEIIIFDSLEDIPEELYEEFKDEDFFEEISESYEIETREKLAPPEGEPIPDFETLKREMGIPTLEKIKRKIPGPPRRKSGAFAPKKIGNKKWSGGYWRDKKGHFTKKPRGIV